MRRSPLALALVLLPAAASADVFVLALSKKGSPAKADVAAAVAEANAVYKRLGAPLKAVAGGDPFAFDPASLGDGSSVALLGEAADIQVWLKKKMPDHAKSFPGWSGGDEPERSQNDYMYEHRGKAGRGGGRVIAVDWKAADGFAGVLKWTPLQARAFLLVHGSGHNSDLDGALQHGEYGGIMTDGAVMQAYSKDMAYEKVTSKSANAKLIAHLQSRYQ